jgi:hypothetical protein
MDAYTLYITLDTDAKARSFIRGANAATIGYPEDQLNELYDPSDPEVNMFVDHFIRGYTCSRDKKMTNGSSIQYLEHTITAVDSVSLLEDILIDNPILETFDVDGDVEVYDNFYSFALHRMTVLKLVHKVYAVRIIVCFSEDLSYSGDYNSQWFFTIASELPTPYDKEHITTVLECDGLTFMTEEVPSEIGENEPPRVHVLYEETEASKASEDHSSKTIYKAMLKAVDKELSSYSVLKHDQTLN